MQLCNCPPSKNTAIKDISSITLTSAEGQQQRGTEHFQEILNTPQPTVAKLQEEPMFPHEANHTIKF